VSSILLDTHVWVWSLMADPRLSAHAVDAIRRAESVFVSPITFFEIGQKVRMGKWPEMEPFLDQLAGLPDEQGGRIAVLDPQVCLLAATMAWDHRDPFDRMLAASAIHHGLILISADTAFDSLVEQAGWTGRHW